MLVAIITRGDEKEACCALTARPVREARPRGPRALRSLDAAPPRRLGLGRRAARSGGRVRLARVDQCALVVLVVLVLLGR